MTDAKGNLKKDTLFLHMGPGMSSFPEREILGAKFKNVNYWDQPPISSETGAFRLLTDAAEAELRTMCQTLGAPIKITAHCFGARIAQQLLVRSPQMIGDCVFINPTQDVPQSFYSVLKKMVAATDTDPQLRTKILELMQTKTVDHGLTEDIWTYVQLMAQDPIFMRHYWPKSEQFSSFLKIASTGPQFDFTTFHVVLNDFLTNYFGKESVFNGRQKIEIQLGESNPLVDVHRDVRVWKAQFPNAKFTIRSQAGHFAHLEEYL